MNQHFQSYLIGSVILTILWWIIQYFTGSSISNQVDPGGNFSGSSATTKTLEGFIQEVQQLPQ